MVILPQLEAARAPKNHLPSHLLQQELERKTGFEPATPSLARRCSTTEPLPLEVRQVLRPTPRGVTVIGAGFKMTGLIPSHLKDITNG